MGRLESVIRPAVHGGRDLARRQRRRSDPARGPERPGYLDADFDIWHVVSVQHHVLALLRRAATSKEGVDVVKEQLPDPGNSSHVVA